MLDNAVFVFGATLSAELDNVDGKTAKEIETKRSRVLSKFLREPGTRRFKDPAKRKQEFSG